MSFRCKWSGSLAAMKEHEEAVKLHPPKLKEKKQNQQKAKKKKNKVKPPLETKKPKGIVFYPYKEYLKSNWWKMKRKQKLRSAGWKCEKCSTAKNLQVHHLHYKSLGKEKNKDLQVLCKNCHEKVHEVDIQMDRHIRSIVNGNY